MATKDTFNVATVNVTLTVGGRNIPVARAALMLTENGIPSARLNIDPRYTSQVKSGQKSQAMFQTALAVKNLDFSNIKYMYDDLTDLAKKRAKVTLGIEVVTQTTAGSTTTEKIELKDWILIQAGVMGSYGNASFDLSIEHPANALKAESIISSYLGLVNYEVTDTENAKDITDLLSKALTAGATKVKTKIDELHFMDLGNVKSMPGVLDYKSLVAPGIAQLKGLASYTKKYLKWRADTRGKAFPCQGIITNPTDFKYYLLAMSDQIKRMAGYTYFDFISTLVNADTGMVILPTYLNEYLTIAPAMPWVKPNFSIPDSAINQIIFPAADYPVIAATISAVIDKDTREAYTILMNPDKKSSILTPSQVIGAYAEPEMIKVLQSSEPVKGRVVSSESNIVGNYLAYAQVNKFKSAETPESTAAKGKAAAVPEPKPSELKEGMALYNKCAAVCAKYYYTIRKSVTQETSMRCKLMFKHKSLDKLTSGAIIPGLVVSVGTSSDNLSESADKPMHNFYIVNVTHTLDAMNGTASTEIFGRYSRSASDTFNGTANPLYA